VFLNPLSSVSFSSLPKLLAFAATPVAILRSGFLSHSYLNTFGILGRKPSLCKYRSKAALLLAPELPYGCFGGR
jgi:hypothetical protein